MKLVFSAKRQRQAVGVEVTRLTCQRRKLESRYLDSYGLYLPLCIILLLAAFSSSASEWPMLRGSFDHAGYVQADIKRPFRLVWATELPEERLGTAMEPIVADDKV